MFMEIAHVVSKRATCMRLSVGAVLVRERSIVAIGYNGAPAGAPHCAGNQCPGRFSCRETTHAEVNAIHHLPMGTEGPLDMYVTDSPCSECWSMIRRDERIERVFFDRPYRNTDHLDSGGPKLYRVTPSGYVMSWGSKLVMEIET